MQPISYVARRPRGALLVLGVSLAAGLAACSPSGAQQAEAGVRAIIKNDPASAKFEGTTACIAPGGYFGQVEQKNAAGAYDGPVSFVYLGGKAAIAGDSNFVSLMNQCTGSGGAATNG